MRDILTILIKSITIFIVGGLFIGALGASLFVYALERLEKWTN